MKFSRYLNKPEYAFRPEQILRRFKKRNSASSVEQIQLLGQSFFFNSKETIGRSLLTQGVYDLALTECLWRLTEPGHKALDIGSNIGYMSLVLAHRVGTYGEVHAFEPHPELQKKWTQNLKKNETCQLWSCALSSQSGVMDLFLPSDFSKNEGTATLEKSENCKCISVPVKTIDEIFKNKKIDLIKIDVEGHELEVLKGGIETIKHVKNIFFEDFKHSKSSTIQFLKNQGFTIFRVYKGFFGVQLLSVEQGEKLPLCEPPNYVATRDQKELFKKINPRGWRSLKVL